jgi:hypothetical protein
MGNPLPPSRALKKKPAHPSEAAVVIGATAALRGATAALSVATANNVS